MDVRKATQALATLLLAGCAGLPAGVVRHGDLRIDHMVIPAASETGGDVAAYAAFDNDGAADRLLGAECACAASVELHRVVRDGAGMTMTSSFPLELPAAARTEVKPPGVPLHFMLMRTNRTFAAGEHVPMRLRFERAGVVEVRFVVAPTSKEGWERWPSP